MGSTETEGWLNIHKVFFFRQSSRREKKGERKVK